MTIERKTVLDTLSADRQGNVNVRVALLLVEGGQEIFCTWHRFCVAPGQDQAEQMDNVNADFASRTPVQPPLSTEDIARVITFQQQNPFIE